MQGVRFVGTLHSTLKNIPKKELDPEIQQWLQVLLTFVVITEPKSVEIFISETENYLKIFSIVSKKLVGWHPHEPN